MTYPNGDEMFNADPSSWATRTRRSQAEFARLAADRAASSRELLVIGGGGYTFPRWADDAAARRRPVEVVEIDPGVTEVAHRKLGLPRDTTIVSHHMDGRQFVQEQAPKGSYQLVVQDAVNDLSVPYHIMTKEYNDAVKQAADAGRRLPADGDRRVRGWAADAGGRADVEGDVPLTST